MTIEVQLYLKMDRVDLAAKVIKTMADVDDDDPLTQLATAWVYIAQGGDKISEAFYLLQELIEKFGQSVSVLNSLAVCQLHLKNFSQAFQFLKQARNLRVDKGKKSSSGYTCKYNRLLATYAENSRDYCQNHSRIGRCESRK